MTNTNKQLRVLATALTIATLTMAALHRAAADTLFFSDSFDRADDLNLDTSTNGMSGLLISAGALAPNNTWIETTDAGSGNDADSQVIGNQLQMGGHGHSVQILVNQNFANIVSNGLISFSLDLVNPSPGGATPVQRYSGFGVGFTLAEGNVYADRRLTRVADLYVAETENGLIRINDEDPSTRPTGTADVPPTTTIDLDSSSATFIPGTLRVDLMITNMAVGSTVTYNVLFNSTNVATGRSFILTDDNEFYAGLEERSASAITDDNFAVNAIGSYTPPPVNALTWRASTDNTWDTTAINWVDSGLGVTSYAFFSGANVTFNDATADATVNVPGPVTPGNLLVNNVNSNYIFSGTGSIEGAGSLIKSGAGIMTMSLSNAFSGGVTLSAGRLRIGNDNAFSSGLVTFSGGAISSDGTTARTLSNPAMITIATTLGDTTDNGLLTFSHPVDFTGGNRRLTINSDVVFAGGITNGQVGNKQGPAALILKGQMNFAGTCDVTAGSLIVDGATITNTDRIIPDASAGNLARLVITNGGTVVVTAANNNLRAGRVGDVTGTNIIDLAGVYRTDDAVDPDGYATLYLGCAWSEIDFLPGGDYAARGVQTYGTGSANTLVVFDGGILRARQDNPTFMEGLSEALVKSRGANIDDGGFNIAINQPLLDGGGGGGLTKFGSGSLTLGGACTYTGNTVVSNGTLVVTTSSLTGGGGVVVADGSRLSVTNMGGSLSVPSLTMGSAGASTLQFNFPFGNPGAASIVAGTVTANGSVAINITGTGLTAGTFPLLDFTSAAGIGNFHLGSVQPGVSATLQTTATGLQLTISKVVNAIQWSSTPANNEWDTSSTNWLDTVTYSPTNYSQAGGVGDAVTFSYSVTNAIHLPITVTPVAITVDSSAPAYSFTGAGKISGVGSLTMNGYFPLTLGTTNDYSGGTTVNAGAIYVGTDQALGSGPVTINYGTLAIDSTAARTLSNSIIQNADLGVYFGDSVNTGTLTLAGGLNLGGGTTRTLDFYSDVVISGSLTNGGITTKTGPGAMIIQGDSGQSALATQQQGDVIVDGAQFTSGDGWRLQNTSPGSTIRLVVANGGVFNVGVNHNSANLRIGLPGGDNSATNVLDISGTVNLTPQGAVAGNSAVNLGGSGANDILYLRSGGLLLTRALYGVSPANSEVYFMGGTLKAIANESGFLQDLTSAYMEDRGLTIDTTNFSVTASQPLLASGTGGLTKEGTGTLTLLGASTYTGPTMVNAGKLVLGATFASPSAFTVNADSTLAFQQSSPSETVEVSSVTAGGGANSALEAELAGTNTPAGYMTNLTLNGSVAVNVTGPIGVGEFPLFGYGTISGPGSLTLGQLPLGTVASLVTNTTAHTIDLVVSGIAQAIWVGNVSADWDMVTTNWLVGGNPAVFAPGANVVFDDSANASVVNLTTTLSPGTVVVSNSVLNYQFSGPGGLSGSTTLAKAGNNSLTINTADTFAGNVMINGGAIVLGSASALGSAANTVYITNSGTLDVDGQNIGLQPVIASGSGVNGNGAIYNSGGDQNNALRNVTLTGDTTFGGTGNIGLRTTADSDPGLIANGHKLIKVGSNALNLNGGTTVAGLANVWFTDIGDIDIQQGILSFQRRVALGNPTNTITIESGGALDLFSLDQSLPVPTNRIAMNNGTLDGTGAAGTINTLDGQITLNGANNAINVTLWVGGNGPTTLYLNGPIVGSGGVYFSGSPSNGVIQLAGNDTYTGSTVVSDGTLALVYGASLTGTTNITIATNGTFDVTALYPWTSGANQTLGGSGAVNGSVVANGTVAPGGGTGTLTINGDLTLAGNVLIEVNKSLAQSNDMASVSGSLMNTGTGIVMVTNLGPALAVGDTFTLFNQPVVNGNTLTVTGGYATWTNNLALDGSISVLSVISPVNTNSVPISFTYAGGNLNLHWPTDHTGWHLEVQTNSLAAGLSTNWSSWPGSSSTNAVAIPVNPNNPTMFFRLVYP